MKFILFFLLISITISVDLNSGIPEYSKIRFIHGNHSINRPLFHFTPDYGWMNDPNGCWFDSTTNIYHIYFQYNPHDIVWGMPLYWGHAYSTDLLQWTEDSIAIKPSDWAGAYSGSMFIDDECAFNWFEGKCTSDDKNANAIAAWTWNLANWTEVQCLSYSLDKGKNFITDDAYCPHVVNGSDQFRDPQVIKVDSKTYVMSVAKSHEYSIYFYKSLNGGNFTYLGEFTLAGYLGFQYECPNLIHLKNSEKTDTNYTNEDSSYWVLFISINPGSQQGGSSTEYFFGQFDHTATDQQPYKLNYTYTTLIDQGKDFYAMQLMYHVSTDYNGFDTGIGITWASNWQYSKEVPTDPWRSSMAIPREIKISHYIPAGDSKPILYIKSRAILNDIFDTAMPKEFTSMASGDTYDLTQGANGALEFELTFDSCDAYTDHDPGVLTLYLRGGSIPEEYLRFGFHQKADAFFLDRGHTRVQWVHDHPFFTDKLSMTVYGNSTTPTQSGFTKEGYVDGQYTQVAAKCDPVSFQAHVIIDRNIFEVFFNEDEDKFSFITATNTFFFTGGNYISSIGVEYNVVDGKYGFQNVKLRARQLNIGEKSTNTETEADTEGGTDTGGEGNDRRRLNHEL